MIRTKMISSMEKVFCDESFDSYQDLEKMTALKGERVSVQLLYTYDRDEDNRAFVVYRAQLDGDLAIMA